MEEILARFVSDLSGRLTGPLTMRLFLQPAVAGFFALGDGLRDARQGRPPHFWRMVTGPPEARWRRTRETWKAVFKVFFMAVVLDCVYQLLALRWVYPIESIVMATILAIIPYVLLRGGDEPHRTNANTEGNPMSDRAGDTRGVSARDVHRPIRQRSDRLTDALQLWRIFM